MGCNINLVDMVGAPESVTSPSCGTTNYMCFDDYDIEGDSEVPSPQMFVSGTQCDQCNKILHARIRAISVLEHVWLDGDAPAVSIANVEWQQRIDRSWIAVIGNRVSPAVMRLLPLFDDKWSIEVTCAGQRLHAMFMSVDGLAVAKAKAVELLREHVANELRFLVGVDAMLGASANAIEQAGDGVLQANESTGGGA